MVVCLFACPQDCSKSYEEMLVKFVERSDGRVPSSSWSGFDGDAKRKIICYSVCLQSVAVNPVGFIG